MKFHGVRDWDLVVDERIENVTRGVCFVYDPICMFGQFEIIINVDT